MEERRVKCNYCMSEYDEKYLSKDCAGEEICPVCYLSNEWRYIEYSDPVKAQMLEALKRSRRKHYYCEDSWYSCPKSGEGCSNDEVGDNCNCGADEWNNYVDKIIEAAEKEKRL